MTNIKIEIEFIIIGIINNNTIRNDATTIL